MYGGAHTLMEVLHIDLKKMLYKMSLKKHSAKVSKAAFDCPILRRFIRKRLDDEAGAAFMRVPSTNGLNC